MFRFGGHHSNLSKKGSPCSSSQKRSPFSSAEFALPTWGPKLLVPSRPSRFRGPRKRIHVKERFPTKKNSAKCRGGGGWILTSMCFLIWMRVRECYGNKDVQKCHLNMSSLFFLKISCFFLWSIWSLSAFETRRTTQSSWVYDVNIFSHDTATVEENPNNHLGPGMYQIL